MHCPNNILSAVVLGWSLCFDGRGREEVTNCAEQQSTVHLGVILLLEYWHTETAETNNSGNSGALSYDVRSIGSLFLVVMLG